MTRKINNQKTLWLLVGLLSLGLTSCLGNREWSYPPQPSGTYLGVTAKQSVPARLVVLPLKDHRGRETQSEYWRAAVPLIPYGSTTYERPENAAEPVPADVVAFDPTQDFARALADEVRESGVFTSVTFAEGGDIPSTDFVLRGNLHSTRWERNITTYLLGPLGTVFWAVGMPMGNTTTSVGMDLELTPARDPSKVLWRFTMEVEWWQLDGPYYGLEKAIQSYPRALQDALRPAVTDLVEKAETRAKFLLPEA